ncbi:MAG TPA: Smr/MutS family protein [Xanthobacteraceae bacterium]|nr:Smr/MutS family protein [Xanthobacteraceae bacterium]
MTRGRDKRGVADDALWDAVKKTIKPLRKSPPKPAAEDRGDPPAITARAQKERPPRAAPPPARAAPALPPLSAIDRRARQKIARGKLEIDARIDLHGLRQSEAKERLSAFLHRAQARGASLVLVITGKGTAAPEGAERGVLRRAVPLWLAMPELRPLVIGFEEAAPAHGGAGALYVRIRKSRA